MALPCVSYALCISSGCLCAVHCAYRRLKRFPIRAETVTMLCHLTARSYNAFCTCICTWGASTCVNPLARPMLDISSRKHESAAGPAGHDKHENAVSEILVARMHSTRKVANIALNHLSKIRTTIVNDRRRPGLSANQGQPG